MSASVLVCLPPAPRCFPYKGLAEMVRVSSNGVSRKSDKSKPTMKMNYFRASAGTLILGFVSLSAAWAQTELIVNGGFESGTSSGWSVSGEADVYSDYGFAYSGSYYLWLGGVTNEVDAAYQ